MFEKSHRQKLHKCLFSLVSHINYHLPTWALANSPSPNPIISLYKQIEVSIISLLSLSVSCHQYFWPAQFTRVVGDSETALRRDLRVLCHVQILHTLHAAKYRKKYQIKQRCTPFSPADLNMCPILQSHKFQSFQSHTAHFKII